MRKSEIRKLKRLMQSATKIIGTKQKASKRNVKRGDSNTKKLAHHLVQKAHRKDSFESLIHSSMWVSTITIRIDIQVSFLKWEAVYVL